MCDVESAVWSVFQRVAHWPRAPSRCAAVTVPRPQTSPSSRTPSVYVFHAQRLPWVCLGRCLAPPHTPGIFPHFFEDVYLLSSSSCCALSASSSSRTDVGVSCLSPRAAALLQVLSYFPGSPSCLDGSKDRGEGEGEGLDLHLGFSW